MKIAHVTPTLYSFSGIDRVVMMLAQEQVAAGHQVQIVTLDSRVTPPTGVSIVSIGMPKKLFWQRVYRLCMFLDRKKIQHGAELLKDAEVVYSHQYPMNLIAQEAKKKYGATYIYYDNGIPGPEVFSSIIEKLYIVLFRWITNKTVRSCDKAISISKYLQSELFAQTGVRSTVVYDKADEKIFYPRGDGGEIRLALQIPPDAQLALFVGRISPHKGIHLLISSFQKLRERVPNAYLVIVGKATFSTYLQQLKEIADDHVIFAGFVSDEDLPKYFAACDVYATATLWEGFDLPLVEAQAMGKPVVAYDVGPHPELIDQHGILTPVKDVAAFAEALVKVLSQS